jgi:dienelactone hydrolase/predicted Ser/Thr protein kinase
MVGRSISHYRVLQELGAGGMGVVYLAEDLSLDRKVALKFLSPDSHDDQSADRLRREARSASALDHPNIATVYEINQWEGRTFVVMAYYAGETLRARLERGPLPIDEVVSIAGQIADGLAAAHQAGIVHRDLKPANVLLTSSGQVKILDFGLAKHIATAEDETAVVLTRAGDVVGTLAYMSPEQARGLDVDARTDIWALGIVIYELVTGRRPFRAETMTALAMSLATDTPPPVRSVVPGIPVELERTIDAALTKDPAKRSITAAEIAVRMRGLRDHAAPAADVATSRRRAVAGWIAAAVLLVAGVAGWYYWRGQAERQWARSEASSEISRLAEREQYIEALDLAERARPHLDRDAVDRILQSITRPVTITTAPEGALVSYAAYESAGRAWRRLGTTPIKDLRVPRGLLAWRIEKDGFEAAEDITAASAINVTLVRAGTGPAGMVRATGSRVPVTFPVQGSELTPATLSDFWIGKHEVTNREFKAFVDADGYSTRRFWKHEFTRDGKTVSWEAAIAAFADATGRAGPASWELGRYPAGQDNLPVTGVSWYEAAAYAEFAGAELPTIYHWYLTSANNLVIRQVLPHAVFSRSAPLPVGASGARHRFGTFDFAGNVKEWILNASDDGDRYVLGGGFDEPAYLFGTADPRSMWTRADNIGFRLARFDPADGTVAALRRSIPRAGPLKLPVPVGDDVFAAYARAFSYDRTPIADVVAQPPDATSLDWTRETVSFPAPYADERITVHLLLPRNVQPPYQPVVFAPGGIAWQVREPQAPGDVAAAFLARSGRALVIPILNGMFERGSDTGVPDTMLHTNRWRDIVVADAKDLSRTIDYLETRTDLAMDKVGYVGNSRGGAFGPVFLALEPRIKAAVFWMPGFHRSLAMPEVHPMHFAPRMKQPVLVLNGRYDAIFPEESSQIPFFKALGAPEHLKRRIAYESGHNLPVNDRIRETIAWFDRHLAPVR